MTKEVMLSFIYGQALAQRRRKRVPGASAKVSSEGAHASSTEG
jgi:hypothetical protein